MSDSPFLPFHEDERRAQNLAGERSGMAPIRAFMPQQHRDFFPLLPYLFTATLDASGAPMASMLWGPKGFAHSPDPVTLRLDALPAADDPAAPNFRAGQPIGLLGLDLSTRRRNRANGRIATVDGAGLTVAVEQSFGNCPRYIQTRTVTPHPRAPQKIETLSALDRSARRLVGTTDTFFVASRSRAGLDGGGLDMSHRGGLPGFVDVQGDTIVVPDFNGNRFFNTLGNLLGDPRAGLLFVDFESGDLLQLQGTVTIDWSDTHRQWRVAVERGWRRRAALPFDWAFGDYAPSSFEAATLTRAA